MFPGLDTAASIRINGLEVGTSNNMFLAYTFDVKDVLLVGMNEIQIVFTSPTQFAQDRFDAQIADHGYMVPPECVDPAFQGECHANHIRKMQASFR